MCMLSWHLGSRLIIFVTWTQPTKFATENLPCTDDHRSSVLHGHAIQFHSRTIKIIKQRCICTALSPGFLSRKVPTMCFHKEMWMSKFRKRCTQKSSGLPSSIVLTFSSIIQTATLVCCCLLFSIFSRLNTIDWFLDQQYCAAADKVDHLRNQTSKGLLETSVWKVGKWVSKWLRDFLQTPNSRTRTKTRDLYYGGRPIHVFWPEAPTCILTAGPWPYAGPTCTRCQGAESPAYA